MKQRIMCIVVLLAMLCMLLPIAMVGATEGTYTQIEQEYDSYSDDFTYDNTDMLSGQNVSLGTSGWRSKTEAEGAMHGENTLGTYESQFGIVDGALKLYGSSVDTTGHEKTYAQTADTMPALVWTGGLEAENQQIHIDVKKGSKEMYWAVRFLVQENGDGYTLGFRGSYTGNTKAWQLFKTVNGEVTTLVSSDASTLMETGQAGLDISYIDGTISFTVAYDGAENYLSGSYVDEEPFDLTDKSTTVWLLSGWKQSDTGTWANLRCNYFDNFSIKEYVPYISEEEPTDIVYVDAAEGTTDGVITLKKAVPVRHLAYSGEAASGDILVSQDGVTYEKLTAGVESNWRNTLTNRAFQYVKCTNASEAADLKVLTDAESLAMTTGNTATLYRYQGGALASETVWASDNTEVATVENGVITAVGTGSCNITATVGEAVVTVPVTVKAYTSVIEQEYDSYSDDFTYDNTGMLSGQNVSLGTSGWRSKTEAEGAMHGENALGTYESQFGITEGRLQLYGSSVDTTGHEKNYAQTADTMPALVWTGGLEAENQQIHIDVNKGSKEMNWAVRFLVQENGDGYTLGFRGSNTYNFKAWQLFKTVNGEVTTLASSDASTLMEIAQAGLDISYIDGKISFTVAYDGTENYLSGSYVDEAPFDLTDKSTTVWLLSGWKQSDTGTWASLRCNYFDNFSIKEYAPYISEDEPTDIVYADAAEGTTDGVITLKKAVPVRRLAYSGEAASGDILVSQDGVTYEKLTAGVESSWRNTLTNRAFQYVKCTNASEAADLKVLTDAESLAMTTGNTATLYRYQGGALASETVWASDNEEVATVENGVITAVGTGTCNITATVGEAVVTVPVTVRGAEAFASGVISGDEMTLTCGGGSLKGVTCKAIVAWYNADTLLSARVHDVNFGDDGETTFDTDFIAEAGAFALVYLWNDFETLSPVTDEALALEIKAN